MGLEPEPGNTLFLAALLQSICVTDRDHIKQSIPVVPRDRDVYRSSEINGVDDGTRTHDDRDHNPGLYQLSYAHHCSSEFYSKYLQTWCARQDSNLQHLA